MRFPRGGAVFVSAVFLFLLTVCIFVGVFRWSGRARSTVKLDLEYYLLVREATASTAGSVAGDSYLAGGAGYLYDVGGETVVVLSCYYTERDATVVQATMSERGVQTTVLKRTRGNFSVDGGGGKSARIAANAKTLDSCARLLYDTANGLERTQLGQDDARAALGGVVQSLGGLAEGNGESFYGLWNVELQRIQRRARETGEGIVFARDLRYLQVALCVLNLEIERYFA